jgi:hypothetical protein
VVPFDLPVASKSEYACDSVNTYIENVENRSLVQSTIFHLSAFQRSVGFAFLSTLLLALLFCNQVQAQAAQPLPQSQAGPTAPQTVAQARVPDADKDAVRVGLPEGLLGGTTPAAAPGQLIVIGFMGGNVNANNLIHREALVAKDLQQSNPKGVYAEVFANSDGQAALKAVLKLLDRNKDGNLTASEKNDARVVIFGHSWGASEGITLARRLNDLKIPVLLTIQVDSVQKPYEDDSSIPPNVHEAINFYQTEGMLHGRRAITAADPKQTTILGNFQSSYKTSQVSVAAFPWYARTFMKPHIEIENDPLVWGKIEALIQTQVQ